MVRACIRHIHGNQNHRFFRFRLLVITVSTICWQLTVFSVRWYSVLTVSSVCRNSILTVSSICWQLTVSSERWYSVLAVSSVCWYSVLTVSSICRHFLSSVCFWFGFRHIWSGPITTVCWHSVLTVSSVIVATHLSI